MFTIMTNDPVGMGRVTANLAADHLRTLLQNQDHAYIVVATGASQFEVLSHLVTMPDIDWARVTGFHLDEYVGLSDQHPASFCRYLRERFVSQVPLADFHYLRGDADAEQTIAQTAEILRRVEIDLTLCGIGENGHLAFNDPPADFETDSAYLIVELDQPCRQQQVGEGWFASLDEVPTHAMSMSIRQILKSKKILCSVPDRRKAEAVRSTLEDEISPMIPASVLRRHADTTLIIDQAAGERLSPETRSEMKQG
ncbi:glucosamine-6-phosphate deaminase [Neorhodopirellula pilleata]|uniref:Glucosamine-6-phosphate deaminase 1 n=1 Tax=Neorhodopirellula pilleata TaxID=2714738 RepID=A0A5C6AW73_9BACT|nr:glucosamine-6-phosphate deaminase [Neorhodopirellula pilleata]TWU03878.1 Glucosamine-6-phosphate deaminase 1 [Neorhodopirellula pilleata]